MEQDIQMIPKQHPIDDLLITKGKMHLTMERYGSYYFNKVIKLSITIRTPWQKEREEIKTSCHCVVRPNLMKDEYTTVPMNYTSQKCLL